MDVIKKAKELAEEILKTDEYLNLTAAEEVMNNDEEARILMQDMELLQQEYISSVREGSSKEDLAELEQYLQEKHGELTTYAVTSDYIKTKAAFDALIKKINSEITAGITGCKEDDCSDCSGCN